MKQRIIVTSVQLRTRAATICQQIPLDSPHIVTIVEQKESRSDKQHRYYRHLIGVIAAELGNDRDSQHFWYKQNMLVDIFLRDDDYYRAVYQGVANMNDNKMLNYFIDQHTSTTKTSVKQMREYIDQVYHHALSLNVRFPLFEAYQ